MLGLESLSKEMDPTLLDQIKSSKDLTDEQLNSPVGGELGNTRDIASDIKNQGMPSMEELNRPLTSTEVIESSGLSLEDRILLKEETGWSDEVIDAIRSREEAHVYTEAGLIDVKGNLERTDIDWDAKIPQEIIDRMRSLYGDEIADKWNGKSNMDLIREGKAPYGSDNKRINLHHIGQKTNSPLAELTDTEHKSNDSILHDKLKPSEIERPVFKQERVAYWQNRYEELNKR